MEKLKNKTVLNQNILKEYNYHHLISSGLELTIVAISMIFAIWCFYNYLKQQAIFQLFFGLMFIVLAILNRFIIKLFISLKLSSEKNNEVEIEYVFYEDYFTASETSNAKYKYKELKKIRESKNCYYLYVHKNSAFIISKSSFISGDEKDFKKLVGRK